MAKPTERQKAVIELLKAQCDYWLTTNDIHSPSHATDIESELANLGMDGTLGDIEADVLARGICYVWSHIASLDECTVRSSHGG